MLIQVISLDLLLNLSVCAHDETGYFLARLILFVCVWRQARQEDLGCALELHQKAIDTFCLLWQILGRDVEQTGNQRLVFADGVDQMEVSLVDLTVLAYFQEGTASEG